MIRGKRYPIGLFLASSAALLVIFQPVQAGLSPLNDLQLRYYLAQVEDRPGVLAAIRDLGTDEALEFTLSLLNYPDVRVRLEAVDSLKGWGRRGYRAMFEGMDNPEISWMCESIFVDVGSEAVPFLIDMLEDGNPYRRARAAYLLGMVKDRLAVGPLYKCLEDPSREVRIQAIQALTDLGNEEALSYILELFDAEDVGLKDFVLLAAERFGWRASRVLEASLKSESEKVRSGAAMALGRIRVPASIPLLVQALGDPSPVVRRNVTRALGRFEMEQVRDALILALSDRDPEVQKYASDALSRYGEPIVPFLISHLTAADALVRKNAISSLRKIGDARAVVPVIKRLEDPDPTVRMFAVSALMEFRDPRSIRPLIYRLEKEEKIHWMVSFAFMEIGQEAVEELLDATGSQEFCFVRNLIILRMGDKAIDVLHERARTGSGNARLNAITMLGELKRPESIPVLSQLLGEEEVGWVAAHSMARMGEEGWRTLVSDCSGTGVQRTNALKGLSMIEGKEAYPFLLEGLSAEDQEIRRAVSSPLVKAGADAVAHVVERMVDLPDECFQDAAEILCRIDDDRAADSITSALFPQPWTAVTLDKDRLFRFRQMYASRGSLDRIRNRLRAEIKSTSGGGTWQRVAP